MRRCVKCGVEIGEKQQFCNTCGSEQTVKSIKEKKNPKINFGIVKFSSPNHLKMILNFFVAILLIFYTIFFDKYYMVGTIDVSAMSFLILFSFYLAIQIFLGYKNPQSTFTKRYRYVLIISIVVFVFMFIYLLFINNNPIVFK